MKILTRYIASSIVRLIVVVFLVILAVEFFVSLVGEFGDMGNGNYGVFHAVIYVILSLPTNLYSLFPMIGLIGSIIGLGMFPGSKGIRKAIDELQPDLHLCGHIHESAGIEEVIDKTRVVNVGRSGRIFEL